MTPKWSGDMFDAEKLLGKIVGEVMGKKGHSGKSGKKSMLDSLTSGAGLMTVIGLGVGAYEILKQQQGQSRQTGGFGQAPPPPPPGGASFGVNAPPPPPGGNQTAAPPSPPPPSMAPGTQPSVSPAGALAGRELAIRMIQVMVAAAHSDGVMDQNEERAVLDKLRGANLSQEERMFLLEELHRPKNIEELTAGINDPAAAKTMYMLAVAAIEIDTETERAWLDQLAGRLGLSKEMRAFIEEQC
jgi:uncharacterized membrane protein YebE (DUF533 family)